jgi:hypothetical protein
MEYCKGSKINAKVVVWKTTQSDTGALRCQCHLRHDAVHHAKNARVTGEKKKKLTNKLFV